MQNGGVNNVISNICMFLHREIFHVDGAFFDKIGTLVEFLTKWKCVHTMNVNIVNYLAIIWMYVNIILWICILYEF
jgi:hypothetical protein